MFIENKSWITYKIVDLHTNYIQLHTNIDSERLENSTHAWINLMYPHWTSHLGLEESVKHNKIC